MKAGTRRGRIVWKGDSTSTGEGGGDGSDGLGDARLYRPAAYVAANLSAAGVSTLDAAVVGDQGNKQYNTALSYYDSRVKNLSWTNQAGQDFAGGALLKASSNALEYEITNGVFNRCRVVYYASGAASGQVLVNGAGPEVGTFANVITGGGGFGEFIVGINTPGRFNFKLAGDNGVAYRSFQLYNTAAPAVDILVHAARGATSTNQAKALPGAGDWANLEALKYDAPDLTVINVGLNDMASGASVSSCETALRALIAAGRISGDVLVVFPHPGGSQFGNNVTSFHATTKAVCSELNVTLFSLYEYFGSAFTPAFAARMYDGVVHPKRECYAEIGQRISEAIKRMAPAAFA